jgi:hypothetical protein
MPGYSNVVDRWHDEAITLAECETVHLRATRDNAWHASAVASTAYDEAFSEAYNRAYEKLRDKNGT